MATPPNFKTTAALYENHDYVVKTLGSRLRERLRLVRIAPRLILDLGAGTGAQVPYLLKAYPEARIVALDHHTAFLSSVKDKLSFLQRRRVGRVCAEMATLPFPSAQFDLIFCNIAFPFCREPDLLVHRCATALKPGGLFVFNTLGPQSLDLYCRTALFSPLKTRFSDIHDLGDRLAGNGFADVVMETEPLTLTYKTTASCLRELRAIGFFDCEAPASGDAGALDLIRGFYRRFPPHVSPAPLRLEIVYGHAWRASADVEIPFTSAL